MGGSREHRALYRYRERIFFRWGVPPTPVWAAGAGADADGGALAPPSAGDASPPLVLVVQTKRVVTNLAAFVGAINAAKLAEARLIKWEPQDQ